MPVCFEKKYIFIHIPKTGGTTIASRLKIPSGMHAFSRSKLRISVEECFYTDDHIPAWILKKIKPNEFGEYYKFSFVRNPYDRAISEFFWFISDKLEKVNNVEIENEKNIKNWLLNKKPLNEEVLKSYFDKWIKTYFNKKNFDRKLSQKSYLFNKEKTKMLVDDVYKFEDFESEFERLCKKINFSKSPNSILSVSKDSKIEIDRNILLTSENKDHIYSLFKEDFDAFGYSKEYTWASKK